MLSQRLLIAASALLLLAAASSPSAAVQPFSIELPILDRVYQADPVAGRVRAALIMRPLVPGLELVIQSVTPNVTFDGGVQELRVPTSRFNIGPEEDSGIFIYTVDVGARGSAAIGTPVCHSVTILSPEGDVLYQTNVNPAFPGDIAGTPRGHCGKKCSLASTFAPAVTAISHNRLPGRSGALLADAGPRTDGATDLRSDGHSVFGLADLGPAFDVLFAGNNSNAEYIRINPRMEAIVWNENDLESVDDPRFGRVDVSLRNADPELNDGKRSIAYVTSADESGTSFFPASMRIYFFQKMVFNDLGITVFNKDAFILDNDQPVTAIPPRYMEYRSPRPTPFYDIADPDGEPLLIRRTIVTLNDLRFAVVSGRFAANAVPLVVGDPGALTPADQQLVDRLTSLGYEPLPTDDDAPVIPPARVSGILIAGSATSVGAAIDSGSAPIMYLDPALADGVGLDRYLGAAVVEGQDRIAANPAELDHYIYVESGLTTTPLEVAPAPAAFDAMAFELGIVRGRLLATADTREAWLALITFAPAGSRDRTGRILPAHRSFFGLAREGLDALDDNGRALFDNLLRYTFQHRGTVRAGAPALRSGQLTFDITLDRATWAADLGTPSESTTALIQSLRATTTRLLGWNRTVQPALRPEHIQRIDDRTVRVQVPAIWYYLTLAPEEISLEVPGAATSMPSDPIHTSATMVIRPGLFGGFSGR
ncbi:MAG TPA: hypothetical protein VEL07_16175 [Planctomycetota bacterium]|nr:hypothetical protein [Planctomycetota bacterium]